MGKMFKKRNNCHDCGYFEELNEDYGHGECRIDRPTAADGWPHVSSMDWCGEFEPIDGDIDD